MRFFFLAQGDSTVSPLHLPFVKTCVRVMFSSLLTPPQQPAFPQPLPPRQPPAQDRQGQHPALCTLHSVGLSGRLAIQPPLTGYEPNMTFDLPAPGETPANATSRRSSICSQATSVDNAPTITLSASQNWEQRSERLASPHS